MEHLKTSKFVKVALVKISTTDQIYCKVQQN